jgi:flagellar FliJ protein
MSNRSLDPLMALLAQAERERDDAMSVTQRALEAERSAHHQVEQLVNYRGEYDNRFRTQFSQNGSVDILQCYHGFTGRLNSAIEQQKNVAAHSSLKVEQARVVLREQEIRVASVRKLLERRLSEMRIAADRRDQKATDEFAARAAWNRLSAA